MEVVFDLVTLCTVLSSFGTIIWYARGLEARLSKVEEVLAGATVEVGEE